MAANSKVIEPELTNWAGELAQKLHGLPVDKMTQTLLYHALPKPWKDYPNNRRSNRTYFTAKELWELSNKIDKYSIPEPMSGCWIWLGGHDKDGFGITGFAFKQVKAHRASYLVYRGSIPPGFRVCHACNILNCCNPEHLWLKSSAAIKKIIQGVSSKQCSHTMEVNK